jgi:hypothetical protein
MVPLLRYIRSFGDSENRAFLEEPVKSMKAFLLRRVARRVH